LMVYFLLQVNGEAQRYPTIKDIQTRPFIFTTQNITKTHVHQNS